ncbi:MAG: hypothetical protein JWM98_333 [Thermoleophilia bacterium]|nr:hypothetical protein [Thermoleophilia bacterium]
MTVTPHNGLRQRIWEHRHPDGEQLHLPFDVPGAGTAKLRERASVFLHDFAPKAGSNVLMRVGVPMVAATTPVVLDLIDTDGDHSILQNLAVGAGLGGAWGAMVGATFVTAPAEQSMRRLRSSAKGAAAGIVLAPAVAIVSKYVVDWVTRPIRHDLEVERAADRK